jgi:hypothetical protein
MFASKLVWDPLRCCWAQLRIWGMLGPSIAFSVEFAPLSRLDLSHMYRTRTLLSILYVCTGRGSIMAPVRDDRPTSCSLALDAATPLRGFTASNKVESILSWIDCVMPQLRRQLRRVPADLNWRAPKRRFRRRRHQLHPQSQGGLAYGLQKALCLSSNGAWAASGSIFVLVQSSVAELSCSIAAELSL